MASKAQDGGRTPAKRARKTLLTRYDLQQADKGVAPIYSRPKEIGTFTLDNAREFHMGTHDIKTYHTPDMPTSLIDGFPDRYEARDEDVDEHLDFVLRFVQASPRVLTGISIVTFRGLLTKIMAVTHSRTESLALTAQRYKGVIYLCEQETEAKKEDRRGRSTDSMHACYAGYKFEAVATREKVLTERGRTQQRMLTKKKRETEIDDGEGHSNVKRKEKLKG